MYSAVVKRKMYLYLGLPFVDWNGTQWVVVGQYVSIYYTNSTFL